MLFKKLKLSYSDIGKGDPVLLLHGFLENSTMWVGIREDLSSSCRIIDMDLLGHGDTGNLGYIHKMEDQADLVIHLADELGLESLRLVGHSMGGYVALAVAEKRPVLVKGLCLMNSTSRADSEERKINRDRGIEAVKHNHRSFVRLAIPALFAENNREKFRKEIEGVTEEALKIGPQGIIAALEGMKVRKDRSALWKDGGFEKMMIIGEKDPALPATDLLKQAKAPGVEKVVFKDGHMSHIENREELLNALRGFTLS